MKWSLTVARLFGVDLKIHVTFVLILFLGAANWSRFGVEGMVFGAGLMALLFVCVALHELGHAVAAQRLGIGVREILLSPIGGVALLARNPDRPLHELLIAAAGPAVNVVIAAALCLALSLKMAVTGMGPEALRDVATSGPGVTAALVWLAGMNVALVVFNLIPAFPLDGGRILRGLLGLFMDWGRATRIATRTGQVLAVALVVWALLPPVNPFLMLIAVLVYFAAGATHGEERARTVLSTRRVGDAYNKHALVLSENDPVSKAADYLLTSYQPDFAVLRGRQFAGVVLREQVLHAIASASQDLPVGVIMRRDCPVVDASARLDEVNRWLSEEGKRVAVVVSVGAYLGLVSLEDLREAETVLLFMQRVEGVQPQGGAAPAPPAGARNELADDDFATPMPPRSSAAQWHTAPG